MGRTSYIWMRRDQQARLDFCIASSLNKSIRCSIQTHCPGSYPSSLCSYPLILCAQRRQEIPILQYLVRLDRGSNPLEVSTFDSILKIYQNYGQSPPGTQNCIRFWQSYLGSDEGYSRNAQNQIHFVSTFFFKLKSIPSTIVFSNSDNSLPYSVCNSCLYTISPHTTRILG